MLKCETLNIMKEQVEGGIYFGPDSSSKHGQECQSRVTSVKAGD